MPSGTFTLAAQISNDRWRHDINNDHWGDLSDLNVVIDSPVGPWPAGTPLHFVLQDLVTRTLALESSNRAVRVFTVDAVILGYGGSYGTGTVTSIVSADAVIFKVISGSFTVNAFCAKGFTLDAVIRGAASFTVDAAIA